MRPAIASTAPAYPAAILEAGQRALKLVEAGHFEKALPYWRQLLAWQQRHLGADDSRSLRSLRNLAAVELAAGHAAEAARLYDELRARLLRLQGPATAESTQAALDLARAWRTQTRFEPAELLTRETLTVLEKANSKDPWVRLRTAEAQELLGTINHEQGRYGQAEQAHRAALGLRVTLGGVGSLSAATAQANLGQALLRQGRYAEALDMQREALAAYRSLTGVDTRRQQATVLPNIAFSLSLLGQGQLSRKTLQEAIALRSALQGMDNPETARLLLNLGALEEDQGNPEQALVLYRGALATMRTRLGPHHLSTAFALQRMAELARSQKRPEQAQQWGLEALQIREKALKPDHPDLATSLVGLGLSNISLGQQKQGEANLQRALDIRNRALGHDHPYTGLAALFLGLTRWENGDQGNAMHLLEHASHAYDVFLRNQAPMMPVRERGRLLASVTEARNALYSLVLQGPRGQELALQTRLNLHGRLEEIERRQQALLRRNPEDLRTVQRLEAISAQLEQELLEPTVRAQLEQQRVELTQTLKVQRQVSQDDKRTERVSTQQIAKALPVGSALVEFVHIKPVRFRQAQLQTSGEPRLVAMILTPEGTVQSVDLGAATPINQAIWRALAETQRAGIDSEQAWSRVGDLVLRPLLPQLKSRHTWFVSADGELHRVPFAALTRQTNGNVEYYADRHKIRLLTSGRDLLIPRKSASKHRQTALVLADPDFNATSPDQGEQLQRNSENADWTTPLPKDWRALRWNRLPGSRGEGESLRELLNAKLMIDSNAASAALEAVDSATFLHVASHGAFLPTNSAQSDQNEELQKMLEGRSLKWDDPMQRAVIVLSGANSSNSNTQSDAYFTAAKASLLQLEGTRLVTLSACDSGKGAIELGDGVYGLRRALAVAGAESSLLSLWKVDDRATRILMESFYMEVKNGTSPEKALSQAQRFMRQHENREWRHPYVWAAFQLYGHSW